MQWSCRSCTFNNDERSDFCLMCDSPKPETNFNNHILETLNNFHVTPHYQPHIYDDIPNVDYLEPFLEPPRAQSTSPEEAEDITEADKDFNEISTYCDTWNMQYTDDSFYPSDRSIGNKRRFKDMPRAIVWLRPPQIQTKYQYAWDVFGDPSPLDVKQGSVGNCWLVSCIALIAERPDILHKIILTKTYNHNGIYKIRLCLDGMYRTVLIDDHFPCDAETSKMLFVEGRHKQLWPSLIEKALAKMLGSYEALINGQISVGLSILTGAPCEKISTEIDNSQSKSIVEYRKNKIWSQLLSAKDACFLIGAGCGIHDDQNANRIDYKAMGLVSNHAYSILDARQYGNYKLIRLRNPWDRFTWKGAWGNEWHGWTEAAKRELGYERYQHEHGTFWMPYEDFLRYFDSLEFAYIRDHTGWKEQRFPFDISPNYSQAFYLSIHEKTEICFNLFQKGVWKMKDYDDVIIIVHENKRGLPGKVVAKSKREHTPTMIIKDQFFERGEYIVVAMSIASITKGQGLPCALAIHSSKPVTINIQQEAFDFYQKSLIQLAADYRPKEPTFPNMYVYNVKDFTGFLYMAENFDHEMYLQAKIDCSESVNCASSRNALVVADSIPPMHRQIMIILTTDKSNEASSFVSKLHFRSSYIPVLKHPMADNDWSEHVPLLDRNGFHTITSI